MKSEQVLDSKQEFKHSEHLQVSSNPNYNNLLRHPLRSSFGWEAQHSSSSSSSTTHPHRKSDPQALGIDSKQLTVTVFGSSPRLQKTTSNGDSFKLPSQVKISVVSKTAEPFLTKVPQGNVISTFGSGSCAANKDSLFVVSSSSHLSSESHQTSLAPPPHQSLLNHQQCQSSTRAKVGSQSKLTRSPHLRSKTHPEVPFQPARPHEYRRSHSERDNSDDIQMKLRRLLNTDSKENLNSSLHSETISISVCNNKNGDQDTQEVSVNTALRIIGDLGLSMTKRECCNHNNVEAVLKPRHQQEGNYCIHKSMPDLSRKMSSGHRSATQESQENVPPHLSKNANLVSPKTKKLDYVSYSLTSHKKCLSDDNVNDEVFDNHSKVSEIADSDFSVAATHDRLSEGGFGPDGLIAGIRHRPIFRSKSDISHRYSKSGTDLSKNMSPKRNSRAGAELERFFDTMGLDSSVLYILNTPPSDDGSPVFFNSISTGSSSNNCRGGGGGFSEYRKDSDHEDDDRSDEEVVVGGGSSRLVTGCSKDGISSKDLLKYGPVETSIVERNARVIKWLFNCRKVRNTDDRCNESTTGGLMNPDA